MIIRLQSVFTFIILSVASLAQAQITISAQDILNTIGTTTETEVDTNGNISVDLGSAGENQIWDFTSQIISGYNIPSENISPSGTPFSDNFPEANFVQKTVFDEDEVKGDLYSYHNVQPTHFDHLGSGLISGELKLIQPGEENAPLPLKYGSNWSEILADTLEIFDGYYIVNISVINSTIDGWGLLKLPIGDFQSLRLRDDYVNVSQTYISDILTASDTTRFIDYNWIGKQAISLLFVSSEDGNTDPDFKTAGEFSWVTNISTTDVNNNLIQDFPAKFELHQNYPNPFNPETIISYSLPKKSNVSVSIYDVTGRVVDNITPGFQQAGNHEIRWQAAQHLASGAYIYRIQAGDFVSTKKMILIR